MNYKIIITYISIIICIITFIIILLYLNSKKNDSYPFNIIDNSIKHTKIYVINLKHKVERKESTIKLLTKLGFTNYTFVVPVTPEEASLDPLMEGSTLSPSQMSLTITTLNILKEVEDEEFIIMEDDLILRNENYTFIDVYNAAKNFDWDLLYFEFCMERCGKISRVSDCLYKLSQPKCAGFLMFKKSVISLILSNYNNKFVPDGNYSLLGERGVINSYGYPIFKQNYLFGSDTIGSLRSIKPELEDPLCIN